MKLREIVYVSGKPGLYKVIATNKTGFIVESLADQKRIPVSEQHASVLAALAIFTKDEDLPLTDVFQKMKENTTVTVDPKADPEQLRTYFKTIVPDIDEDRVHASHMKKIATWFELLKDQVDFADKDEEKDEDGNVIAKEGTEKPVVKHNEGHGPKLEQAKKGTTAKLRKKV